jgi:hypothetical protein
MWSAIPANVIPHVSSLVAMACSVLPLLPHFDRWVWMCQSLVSLIERTPLFLLSARYMA